MLLKVKIGVIRELFERPLRSVIWRSIQLSYGRILSYPIYIYYNLAIRSISTDAPTANPVTPMHVRAGSLSGIK